MKNQDHYRILPIEMSVSIISYTIGVGVLSLPRALAQELETTDGWVTIMISGFLFMILYTLYVRLQRYFPGQTLLQFIGQGPIGKWGAKCLAILFIIYFITIASILARVLTIVAKMYLLDQTPSEVIVATMLLLTTYAVHKGMQGVVHLNLLFMPIVLFVLTAILAFNLPDFKLEVLRPVLAEGISPVLKALKLTIFAFLGVEVLYFFMAYMKKSDLRALPLNLGVGVITLVYMFVTIFSYSVLSLDATKYITYPMLELAKVIEVPGAFFERLESLMMTIWIMTLFNTITMSQYLIYLIVKNQFFSSKKDSFRKMNKINFFLPSVIQFVIFIVAFIPNSITETATFGDWSGWLGGFSVLAGLSFGYLTVWIRNNKSKVAKKEGSG